MYKTKLNEFNFLNYYNDLIISESKCLVLTPGVDSILVGTVYLINIEYKMNTVHV